jgi:hypothetical protein
MILLVSIFNYYFLNFYGGLGFLGGWIWVHCLIGLVLGCEQAQLLMLPGIMRMVPRMLSRARLRI